MASETVVAVFSTLSHAEAAISDLVASGIPASSIEHYAKDETSAGTLGTPTEGATQHHGFWAWLTGQETTNDQHDVYDRSIQSGRTVVTVISDGSNIDHIYTVLERHGPLDLDEQDTATAGGTSVGGAYAGTTTTGDLGTTSGQGATSGLSASSGMGATSGMSTGTVAAVPAAPATTAATGDTEEVIPLSEETLQVGKREVDRGSTRIRRYVVERPVDEQIRLRNETVSVFRRPVTGTAAVGADAFRDHEIVVTETAEEAVVGKTAHVVEEVVVQKGVQERVETVHDTVRREEVEIDGPTGRNVEATTGTTTTTAAPPILNK